MNLENQNRWRFEYTLEVDLFLTQTFFVHKTNVCVSPLTGFIAITQPWNRVIIYYLLLVYYYIYIIYYLILLYICILYCYSALMHIKKLFQHHLHAQRGPGGCLLVSVSEKKPVASSSEHLWPESQDGRTAVQAWLALLFQPPSYGRGELLTVLLTKQQDFRSVSLVILCFKGSITVTTVQWLKRRLFFSVTQLLSAAKSLFLCRTSVHSW